MWTIVSVMSVSTDPSDDSLQQAVDDITFGV